MAKKDQLRELRAGTVINVTSKKRKREDIDQALKKVVTKLRGMSPIALRHGKEWKLRDIVAHLKLHFLDIDFHHHFHNSSIRPDGGILRMVANNGEELPILIAEVKNQGTNDLRAQQGLKKQAKGNAIERLGKNVIGLRARFARNQSFLLCALAMAATLKGILRSWIGFQRLRSSAN